jgi:hypothetical protein
MKIEELSGEQLDYWVAKAIYNIPGYEFRLWGENATTITLCSLKTGLDVAWSPSTNPAQAYPIIDQNKISVITVSNEEGVWLAMVDAYWEKGDGPAATHEARGSTPLIAAMRAFVASKYGKEVLDQISV